MNNDKYNVEKERRIRRSFIGGGTMAIVVFLVLSILGAGCSSRKTVTSTRTVNEADSVQVYAAVSVEKRERSWEWLKTLCDSISTRITADSVVTPTGAVIHRPVIGFTVARPMSVGILTSHTSEVADSDLYLNAIHAARTQHDTSEDSDRVAVYRPFETSAIAWISAAVVGLLLSLCSVRIYRKWKQ